MSASIKLPAQATAVIAQLEELGYEAYAVGGCVRDSLLGVGPDDWDITTSAMPEQVMEAFSGATVIPTGLQHGTVTLLLEGTPFEVTTFRVDGSYSDSRRPDSVTFTRSIQEDLARRDFTINAMAYHPERGFVDPFGGRNDLNAGIVRCVGEPERRFTEDALRLLRCVRFASTLDFAIDSATREAMLRLLPKLDSVARERVRTELGKALLGAGFERVFRENPAVLIQIIPEQEALIGFDQRTPYHIYDIWEHTLHAVQAAERQPIIRLTMLLHDIGKPQRFTVDVNGVGHFKGHATVSAEMSDRILRRLRYSNEIVERVTKLISYHHLELPPTAKAVKRWLGKLGVEAFRQLMDVRRADASAKNPVFGKKQLEEIAVLEKVADEVIRNGECFSVSQLAIGGKELIAAGMKPGREIGELLSQLTEAVIEEEVPNEQEALLTMADELRRYPT
ncbi:MAG: CCA tRNA nucleotidyltransferase [Oscillospiraceae bacterium]